MKLYCDNGWRLDQPMRLYREAVGWGVEWIDANDYNNDMTNWVKLSNPNETLDRLSTLGLMTQMPTE